MFLIEFCTVIRRVYFLPILGGKPMCRKLYLKGSLNLNDISIYWYFCIICFSSRAEAGIMSDLWRGVVLK